MMNTRTVPTILLLALVGAFLAACSAGEDEVIPESGFKALTKIVSSDVADSDNFGYAVAIDGNYAVAGAPGADGEGTDRGQAYIFLKTQGGTDAWGQIKTLVAGDAGDGDFFGVSVDISGDYIVVGAGAENGTGTDQGAAYVFYRNQGGTDNWGQVKKLSAADRGDEDGFGYSVAIDGDTIIVGSDGEDGAGTDRGAAYIFLKDEGGADNWGQVIKLTATEPSDSSQFGFRVAIAGDYALSGSPREDGAGTDRGAAYVFARNQGGAGAWGLVKRMVPNAPTNASWFGSALAVDGAVAIIGEAWNDGSGTNRGAAYVFGRDEGGADNWGEIKRISASDAEDGAFFGFSVALNGTNAVIGSPFAPVGGTERGQVYLFSKDEGSTDNWGEVQRLRASDAQNEDWFGFGVSISGSYIVAGAIGEDGSGSGRGAAYLFKKTT